MNLTESHYRKQNQIILKKHKIHLNRKLLLHSKRRSEVHASSKKSIHVVYVNVQFFIGLI